MNKKRIGFVTRDLSGGGVESTLFNLINAIDKSIIDVSLIVFNKCGSFLNKIPSNISVYCLYDEELIGARICYQSKKKFQELLCRGKIISAVKVFRYERKALNIIKTGNDQQLNDFYLSKLPIRQEKYDLIVDFHGYGDFTTYYALYKIVAKKYVTWLHDEKQDWLLKCKDLYSKYDFVYGCSRTCCENFLKIFPEFYNKCDVFYNILPISTIVKKSKEFIPREIVECNQLKLLTIGRMTEQKGFDLAIKVAVKLKKAGIDFKWFFIGEGVNKNAYMKLAIAEGVADKIIFLGFKQNPYPYMKYTDIYVQPSRHEGYCTTITEAKIVGCVICATNVSGVDEQIINFETGIIAEIDIKDIFDKIYTLIQNHNLYRNISKNIKKVTIDFDQELGKIYKLVL